MKKKTNTNGADAITNPTAYISIKTDGSNCSISFNGTTVQLVDIVFTAMQRNDELAAIICQTAKDFIDTAKSDMRAWKTLTRNCMEVHNKLAARYHKAPRVEVNNGKTEEIN